MVEVVAMGGSGPVRSRVSPSMSAAWDRLLRGVDHVDLLTVCGWTAERGRESALPSCRE